MKLSLRSLMVSVALAAVLASSPARAQIPVTDILANVSWLQQLLDNASSLLNELEELERMEREYQALTGNRGMANLLRDSRFDNYVPLDALEQIAGVVSQGFKGLSPEARALMPPGMLDRCSMVPESQRPICETEIARPYANAALLRQAMAAQSGRLAQIQRLTDAISTATDPAAIAQLNARLQGENLALVHENNRFAALKAAVENDVRIAAANQRAATLENLNRTGGLRIRMEP